MRILNVEQGTREWHLLRQGAVTGTTLARALGSPKVQETLICELVSELMTEPQIKDIRVPAIIRGKEVEPVARRAVIAETGINFEEVGMLQSESLEQFRFSPDGVSFSRAKPVGGCELKCPDSKKHVEYLIANELPKEYIWQVKAPFIMSDDIEYWYFASFDDRNYERPLFIKRVVRSDFPEIEKERKALAEFLERVTEKHLELTF